MNGFGPIIASLITGPPPKTVKRRTQVLELACVDVQYPQNVGRNAPQISETALRSRGSSAPRVSPHLHPAGSPPSPRSLRPRCERGPRSPASRSHVRRLPCGCSRFREEGSLRKALARLDRYPVGATDPANRKLASVGIVRDHATASLRPITHLRRRRAAGIEPSGRAVPPQPAG